MIKNKNLIERVIAFILKSKKTQFQEKDFEGAEELLKLGVVNRVEHERELYEFESNSPLLTEVLYQLTEEKTGPIPNGIPEAFQKIDELEEILKKENGVAANVINTYSAFLRGLKGYVLQKLEDKGVNVGSFFEKYIVSKERKDNSLFQFEDCFFRFLPHSGYPPAKVLELCMLALEQGEQYYVLDFARFAPRNNPVLAEALYELIENKELKIQQGFKTNLAVALFDFGKETLFGQYEELIAESPDEAFRFFQVIKKRDRKTLNAIFDLVEGHKGEEENVRKTNVLCTLINHEKATKTLREKCFGLIKDYFICEKEAVAHGVLWASTYIEDYEKEKFGLLLTYLERTSNYKALDRFFWRFKNPKYMYELLRSCYYLAWGRSSIALFKEAISHFWTVNRDASESEILKMFEPERNMGLLPVEVIMCGYINPLPVDLLKLDTIAKQKKAIRCFCVYPHSFDILLPMVLTLRKSKYTEVVELLRQQLAQLIVEVYHEILYDAIKNLLGTNTKDQNFLRHMEKALEDYKRIRALKESVDDLNPVQNERGHMDLYYELEHERRTILMDKVGTGKNSFLSHAKRSVIVRGNSWKLPDKDEVSPLNKFAAGHWMHANASLNPDLFEMQLQNL